MFLGLLIGGAVLWFIGDAMDKRERKQREQPNAKQHSMALALLILVVVSVVAGQVAGHLYDIIR